MPLLKQKWPGTCYNLDLLDGLISFWWKASLPPPVNSQSRARVSPVKKNEDHTMEFSEDCCWSPSEISSIQAKSVGIGEKPAISQDGV